MSEIRKNRLTGDWVIIAPERAKRGGNLSKPPVRELVPEHLADCPFCVGNEANEDERFRLADAAEKWQIRSVVNKFSVLSPVGEPTSTNDPTTNEISIQGIGLHEVIVESPRHDLTMARMPREHLLAILETYRNRFTEFYADPRIKHVIVFKNHGAEAGASQLHPHSQIVGLPIVPGQVVDRLHRAKRFLDLNGQCLACVLVAEEIQLGTRIVAENADFVAMIPHAALSPYHLWIFPKIHGACFSEHPIETFPALAEILQTVLAKLDALLGNPPFNLIVRSLGPKEKNAPHFQWYLSVIARINKVAGFELGTGMFVNPSSPEACAQALRDQVAVKM